MQPVTSSMQASSATNSTPQGSQNRKIEKSARDFESLLLSNWLEKAYDSFGTVPGADDEGELDAGKEQLSSIAMQSLAGAMTNSGGVGIAKMIVNHLQSHADTSSTAADAQARGTQALKTFSAQEAERVARSGR